MEEKVKYFQVKHIVRYKSANSFQDAVNEELQDLYDNGCIFIDIKYSYSNDYFCALVIYDSNGLFDEE